MSARKTGLAILLLLALAPRAYVQSGGANTGGAFTGLDVTMIIDQSGSMWGHPRYHPAKNDRYEHRIGQTKNIIYRLAEHVENTAFVHRVSVIDFGDEARVAISNYEMRYDPSDPGSALRKAQAAAGPLVTAKSWTNTNTPAAMAVSLKEYEAMARSLPSTGRKRVMLIITDGRAMLPGKSADTLKAEIRAHAQELKNKGVAIWLVGLNDADNYWNEGDGSFWESVAGTDHARLAETASSRVFTIVQDIVDEWLDIKSNAVAGNEYECPPYQRRIVFNVNFAVPRSPIAIADPDGHSIPFSSGGPSSPPGTNARFQVDDPKPGIYKINKDPSRSYNISVEPLPPNIKRLAPARAASIAAETRLVFQATDNNGKAIGMLSGWPITASFSVTSPSGAQKEFAASFEGDGKFQARWKPAEMGIHKVRLRGLVRMPNGTDYDVFSATGHSYEEQLEVNRLTPYWLSLGEPDPASTAWVWWPRATTRVSFSLLDANNQRVTSLAGLVNDPGTWLSLEQVDRSGAPANSNPVQLVPSASGLFEAEVPVSLAWSKGEGWWMPGQLNLRVAAQADRMSGDNYLDSIQLPQEIETKRVGSDPMTVGPIDVKFALLILLAGVLLLLLLFAAVAWYLLTRLLPWLAVWRADSSRRRTVTLKVYDASDDPNGLAAKKYPAGPGHRFSYDQQLSIRVDGQEYVAKKLRVTRAPSTSQVMAEVKYRWRNDPKKEWAHTLSGGRIQRIKGLPSGDYVLSLDIE